MGREMRGRRELEMADKAEEYTDGMLEGLACILGVVARHQGLDLEADIGGLFKRSKIFNESEKRKQEGYLNAVVMFDNVYKKGPIG